MLTRRELIPTLALGTAACALSSTARSYAQILGANSRLNFALIGLNGRAHAHLAALKANADTARITHICDVDSTILNKFAATAQTTLGYAPATEKDFRNLLQLKDLDAITIATPEHWHTPMAIAAIRAGKHVYVEKPCSHNPAEGALLVAAQKKYGKLVQMGNQRRSDRVIIETIDKIHNGLIGTPYAAKSWYANTRKSIGIGKVIPVPAELDWDLWQGPAPRQPYKDNVHPYNWHWFRRYGTGETLNNGTHEVDVCRWALGVDYPQRISASGGRYNYKDDWQFYDTLVTNFDYGDKLITWEGNSCQGLKQYGRDRGSLIVGTAASIFLDPGGYQIFNIKGEKTDDLKSTEVHSTADIIGVESMTVAHFANFIAAVRGSEKLNSPVAIGNIAVTMLQLSNIAWITNHELTLDTANGKILIDPAAMKLWSREYEPGWEPHL